MFDRFLALGVKFQNSTTHDAVWKVGIGIYVVDLSMVVPLCFAAIIAPELHIMIPVRCYSERVIAESKWPPFHWIRN